MCEEWGGEVNKRSGLAWTGRLVESFIPKHAGLPVERGRSGGSSDLGPYMIPFGPGGGEGHGQIFVPAPVKAFLQVALSKSEISIYDIIVPT